MVDGAPSPDGDTRLAGRGRAVPGAAGAPGAPLQGAALARAMFEAQVLETTARTLRLAGKAQATASRLLADLERVRRTVADAAGLRGRSRAA